MILLNAIWNTLLIAAKEAVLRANASIQDININSSFFKAWIGIWIHTQIYPKPNIKKFWNSENPEHFVTIIPMRIWFAVYEGLLHISEQFLDIFEKILNQEFVKFWISYQNISIDDRNLPGLAYTGIQWSIRFTMRHSRLPWF